MNFLLFSFGPSEILLIALVVLLLFGGQKIPELMHGIGKGVKSFKDGMNGLDDDNKQPSSDKNKHNKTTPTDSDTSK